ncbi:MAG: GntR family transcriptional regulator [Planctomycetota bacterium]
MTSAQGDRKTVPLGRFHAIEPQVGRPLYLLASDAILDVLEDASAEIGDRLPPTRMLGDRMGVSLVTMHRALQELANRGVIERGQGRGTYVSSPASAFGLLRRIAITFQPDASWSDPYHSNLLEGISSGAVENGIEIVIAHSRPGVWRRCDAVIHINPSSTQMTEIARLSKEGELSAAIGQPEHLVLGATHENLHSIDCDNRMMGQMAVEELAKAGHRRIGYIGSDDDTSNSRHRLEGFKDCLQDMDSQVECVFELLGKGWHLSESEHAKLVTAFARTSAPTAIFAAGYYLALDAYSAVRAAGKRVPSDIAVIGVDDPPSAAVLSPPLTTFRQPLVAMGRTAISLAIQLHEQRSDNIVSTILPPVMIPRTSHY